MGYLRRLDDRMTLMGQMFAQTGADLTRLSRGELETEFRSAVYRCLGCKHQAQCQQWLSEDHEHAEAPEFCRNAELLHRARAHA